MNERDDGPSPEQVLQALESAGHLLADVIGVIEVGENDWPVWRHLRRAALTESPAAFGSTLAQWSGAGDTERRWRARLTSVALNLVLTMDGEPVGLVSATAPGADGHVELISLWVAPAARGRHIADEGVRRVLAWAANEHPGSPVVLSVKSDNRRARRLYERHGFVDTGPSPDDPGELVMRRSAGLDGS